jgi:hypothetical protein
MAKMTKIASVKARLKAAVAKNETLQKAGSALKRANTEENRKMLMVGGVAAGAGAVAGYKGQEYIAGSDAIPDSVADIGGVLPLGTAVGALIAGYGALKLKGQAQAAVSGFGGGMAGGAYIWKMANT